MNPTTRAKTYKTQLKRAAAQHVQAQKVQLVQNVNTAVQQYSISTGKSHSTARQEFLTMENISKRKRALCPRDIFICDKMQEINKGMFPFHLHCTGVSMG